MMGYLFTITFVLIHNFTFTIGMNMGGNEKFYFENANVCMIFNAGELSLVSLFPLNGVLRMDLCSFINFHKF